MKSQIAAGAIALITLMGIASADPWNKKTKLDVKETILIPGKELPPGKYVMKLMDSQSNRHIVQIMNEDESKLEATILAIPNYRLQPSGDTELRYWETTAGTPPALRAWFFPGDNFGQEFAYPKDVASKIAAANSAKVPWYDASGQDADALKTTEVHDFEKGSVVAEEKPAAAQDEEKVAAAAPAQEEKPAQQEVAAVEPNRPEAAQPVTPAEPAPAREEPSVLAQNRPQPDPAAATPAPQAAPDNEVQTSPSELPQTGSALWTLGLAGCILFGTGLTLAMARR
jgi:hypothetical protein